MLCFSDDDDDDGDNDDNDDDDDNDDYDDDDSDDDDDYLASIFPTVVNSHRLYPQLPVLRAEIILPDNYFSASFIILRINYHLAIYQSFFGQVLKSICNCKFSAQICHEFLEQKRYFIHKILVGQSV